MDAMTILDRLAIRELTERYAAYAMRIDPLGWGKCWAEDGAWQLSSMDEPVTGRDAIIAEFVKRMEYVGSLWLSGFPMDLIVDGEMAAGKTYTREEVLPKAGGRISVNGCFHDTYVRHSGQWLFKSRRYEVLDIKREP